MLGGVGGEGGVSSGQRADPPSIPYSLGTLHASRTLCSACLQRHPSLSAPTLRGDRLCTDEDV